VICGRPASIKTFKKRFAGAPQAPKPLKSDLREARKHQNVSGKEKGSLYETACPFLWFLFFV